MLKFYKNYMEFFFFSVMLIGLIFALSAPSAVISYFMSLVSGMFAGRFVYGRKGKIMFPYLVIIAGFLTGYLIGAYYGNRIVVIALFIFGAVLAYKIYNKGVLRDFKI